MKISELIELLKKMDQNAEIFFEEPYDDGELLSIKTPEYATTKNSDGSETRFVVI